MATEIKVPPLGESLTEGTVGSWLKSKGDNVALDEPILELETDKVTMEVNAPVAGVLVEISAEVGVDVQVGGILGIIDETSAEQIPSNNGKTSNTEKEDNIVDIVVPALGESLNEGTVASWLKKINDTLVLDEPILELETDKVTLEVNSPCSGSLVVILVDAGAEVEVGAVLGRVNSSHAVVDSSGENQQMSEREPDRTADTIQMSPAVRKMIDDMGYDASQIPATGKGGRLTKGDVLSFQTSHDSEIVSRLESKSEPQVDPGKASTSRTQIPSIPEGPREERVKMTRLRRVIADKLKEAQNTAAMLTTFNEVDMSAIIKARSQFQPRFEKTHGVRLGFMSYFVKAAIVALKEFPAVNAEIQGDEIVYKNYYNIGVAVGTPTGLVVPVLKNADQLSFAEIEKKIKDFGQRAREGKLAVEEMTGGSFTITNGGIYGSMLSTPIINTPQSGILGMHNIVKRPWAVGDEIEVRPIMYLAHSYDHRIIDGREAVSMLVRIKECIEDPQRIMLYM